MLPWATAEAIAPCCFAIVSVPGVPGTKVTELGSAAAAAAGSLLVDATVVVEVFPGAHAPGIVKAPMLEAAGSQADKRHNEAERFENVGRVEAWCGEREACEAPLLSEGAIQDLSAIPCLCILHALSTAVHY